MRKNLLILFVIVSVCFVSSYALAEVPQGFSNAKDSASLKQAWKNKALRITFTDFEKDVLGEKGAYWEFNDFENAKVYIIQPDGSKVLKSEGRVELLEYINIGSPGYVPGQYVLQMVAVGYTFGTGFEETIDPEAKTFKDKDQRLFEVMTPEQAGADQ
ncbi:MAG: hypothetical protein ABII88_05970 [Candidatus Omnitrophota bacterium]